MEFSIGGIEHEKIQVELTGYEREPTGEYYDDTNPYLAPLRTEDHPWEGISDETITLLEVSLSTWF